MLILADRLEVKCGQGPLREVPRERWWPNKLWPNRALLAPLRNTASHCAGLKKRISHSEKGFPSETPGQQAKLCLIIQSLSELCGADRHNLSECLLSSLLAFPPSSPPLGNCPIFYRCRHPRRLSKDNRGMMPVRESLTFECMQQFELWLNAVGATKRA